MLALIACILFVLAAFEVSWDEVNIVALGLAFLAAHMLLGGFLASVWTPTAKRKA